MKPLSKPAKAWALVVLVGMAGYFGITILAEGCKPTGVEMLKEGDPLPQIQLPYDPALEGAEEVPLPAMQGMNGSGGGYA